MSVLDFGGLEDQGAGKGPLVSHTDSERVFSLLLCKFLAVFCIGYNKICKENSVYFGDFLTLGCNEVGVDFTNCICCAT